MIRLAFNGGTRSSLLIFCLLIWNCYAPPVEKPMLGRPGKCASECSGSSHVVNFQIGHVYDYKFSIMHETSFPGSAENTKHTVSGLAHINAMGPCEFSVKLSAVSIEQTPAAPNADSKMFKDLLEKMQTPFAYDNGKFVKICPSFRESVYSRNVKAAVLSHLQLAVDSLDDSSYVSEDDVSGRCIAEYKATFEQPKFHIVNKRKASGGCSNKFRHYDGRAPMSGESAKDGQKLIDWDINSHCEIMHEQQSAPVRVKCNETMKARHQELLVTTSVEKVKVVPNEDTSGWTIPSSMMTSQMPYFKHADILRRLPGDETAAISFLVAMKEATLEERTPHFFNLVEQLSLLENFEKVKDKALELKLESAFVDALMAAKSEKAITYSLKPEIMALSDSTDLVLMNLYSVTEVSSETLGAALAYLNSGSATKTAIMPIGSLVYSFCQIEYNCMQNENARAIADKITSQLAEKCTGDIADVATTLAAIANMGSIPEYEELGNKLLSCVQLDSPSRQMSVLALEAFRRLPCATRPNSVYMKLIDVVKSDQFSPPIRVSAYLALANCWTEKLFEDVVDYLTRPDSGSKVPKFIYSHLMSIWNSKNKQDIKVQAWMEANYDKLLNAAGYMRYKSGFFESHYYNKERSFNNPLGSNQVTLQAGVAVVFDQASPLPAYVKANVSIGTDDYVANDIEVNVYGERIPELERFFGISRPKKNPTPVPRLFDYKNALTSAATEAISEPAPIMTYYRIKGSICYVNTDFEMRQLPIKLMSLYKLLKQRTALTKEFKILTPSIGGLPIERKERVTLITSRPEEFGFALANDIRQSVDGHCTKFGTLQQNSIVVQLPTRPKFTMDEIKIEQFTQPTKILMISRTKGQLNGHQVVMSEKPALTDSQEFDMFGMKFKAERGPGKNADFSLTVLKFDGLKLRKSFNYNSGLRPRVRELLLSVADGNDNVITMTKFAMHKTESDPVKFIEVRVQLPTKDKYGGKIQLNEQTNEVTGDMSIGDWSATANGEMKFDSATQKRSTELLFKSSTEKEIKLVCSYDSKSEFLAEITRADGGMNRSAKIHILRRDGVKNPRYPITVRYYGQTEIKWDTFMSQNTFDAAVSSGDGRQVKGYWLHKSEHEGKKNDYKFSFQGNYGAMFNNEEEQIPVEGLQLLANVLYTGSHISDTEVAYGVKYFLSRNLADHRKPRAFELAIFARYPDGEASGFDAGVALSNKPAKGTTDVSRLVMKFKIPRSGIDASGDCTANTVFMRTMRIPRSIESKCAFVLVPKEKFMNADFSYNMKKGKGTIQLNIELPQERKYSLALEYAKLLAEHTLTIKGTNIHTIKLDGTVAINKEDETFNGKGEIFIDGVKSMEHEYSGSGPVNDAKMQLKVFDLREGDRKLFVDSEFKFEREVGCMSRGCVFYKQKLELTEKVRDIKLKKEHTLDYSRESPIPVKKFALVEYNKINGKRTGMAVKFAVNEGIKVALYPNQNKPYKLRAEYSPESKELKLDVINTDRFGIKYRSHIMDGEPGEKLVSSNLEYYRRNVLLTYKGNSKVFLHPWTKLGIEHTSEGTFTDNSAYEIENLLVATIEPRKGYRSSVINMKVHTTLLKRFLPVELAELLFEYDVTENPSTMRSLFTYRQAGDRGVSTATVTGSLNKSDYLRMVDAKVNLDVTGFRMKDKNGLVTWKHNIDDGKMDVESKLNFGDVGAGKPIYELSVKADTLSRPVSIDLLFRVPIKNIEITLKQRCKREMKAYESTTDLGWNVGEGARKLMIPMKGVLDLNGKLSVITIDASMESDEPMIGTGTFKAGLDFSDQNEKKLHKQITWKDKIAIEEEAMVNLETGLASCKVKQEWFGKKIQLSADCRYKPTDFLFNGKIDSYWTGAHSIRVKNEFQGALKTLSAKFNNEIDVNERQITKTEFDVSANKPIVLLINWRPSQQLTCKSIFKLNTPIEQINPRNVDFQLEFELLPFVKNVDSHFSLVGTQDGKVKSKAKLATGYETLKLIEADLVVEPSPNGRSGKVSVSISAFGLNVENMTAQFKTQGSKTTGNMELPGYGTYDFNVDTTNDEVKFEANSGDATYKRLLINAKYAGTSDSKYVLQLDDKFDFQWEFKLKKKDAGVITFLQKCKVFANQVTYLDGTLSVAANLREEINIDLAVESRGQKLSSKTIVSITMDSNKLMLVSNNALSPEIAEVSEFKIDSSVDLETKNAVVKVAVNKVEMLKATGGYWINSKIDFGFSLKCDYKMKLNANMENAIFQLEHVPQKQALFHVLLMQKLMKAQHIVDGHVTTLITDGFKGLHKLETNIVKAVVGTLASKERGLKRIPVDEYYATYNEDNKSILKHAVANGELHMFTLVNEATDTVGSLEVSDFYRTLPKTFKFGLLLESGIEMITNVKMNLQYSIVHSLEWNIETGLELKYKIHGFDYHSLKMQMAKRGDDFLLEQRNAKYIGVLRYTRDGLIRTVNVKLADKNTGKTIWSNEAQYTRQVGIRNMFTNEKRNAELIFEPLTSKFEVFWDRKANKGVSFTWIGNTIVMQRLDRVTKMDYQSSSGRFELHITSQSQKKDLSMDIVASGKLYGGDDKNFLVEIDSNLAEKICLSGKRTRKSGFYTAELKLQIKDCASDEGDLVKLQLAHITQKESKMILSLAQHKYGFAVMPLKANYKVTTYGGAKYTDEWIAIVQPDHFEVSNSDGTTTVLVKRGFADDKMNLKSLLKVNGKKDAYWEMNLEAQPSRINVKVSTVNGDMFMHTGLRSGSALSWTIQSLDSMKRMETLSSFVFGLVPASEGEEASLFKVKFKMNAVKMAKHIVYGSRLFDEQHVPIVLGRRIKNARFAIDEGVDAMMKRVLANSNSAQIWQLALKVAMNVDQMKDTVKDFYENDDFYSRTAMKRMNIPITFSQQTFLQSIENFELQTNLRRSSENDVELTDRIRSLVQTAGYETQEFLLAVFEKTMRMEELANLLQRLHDRKLEVIQRIFRQKRLSGELNMGESFERIKNWFCTKTYLGQHLKIYFANFKKTIMQVPFVERLVEFMKDTVQSVKKFLAWFRTTVMASEGESIPFILYKFATSSDPWKTYQEVFKPDLFKVSGSNVPDVAFDLQKYIPKCFRPIYKKGVRQLGELVTTPLMKFRRLIFEIVSRQRAGYSRAKTGVMSLSYNPRSDFVTLYTGSTQQVFSSRKKNLLLIADRVGNNFELVAMRSTDGIDKYTLNFGNIQAMVMKDGTLSINNDEVVDMSSMKVESGEYTVTGNREGGRSYLRLSTTNTETGKPATISVSVYFKDKCTVEDPMCSISVTPSCGWYGMLMGALGHNTYVDSGKNLAGFQS